MIRDKRMIGLMAFSVLTVIIITAIILGGRPPKDVYVTAKTDEYNSQEELIKAADLIVTGEKISSENSAVIRNEKGDISMVFTLSKFAIEKKEKGLEEENVITILENAGYDKLTNTNYHINGYDLMEDGNTYKLYLSKAKDGSGRYISLGINAGKFLIEEDEKPYYKN